MIFFNTPLLEPGRLERIVPMAATLTILAIAIATVVSVVVLGLAYPRVKGTTLVSPLSWCVCAVVVCACAGVAAALSPDLASSDAWRLIASAATFCPVMSVLGARRPHHLAWNFVVASLWLVAALPALEQLFLQRASLLDIGPVRGCFMWLMIGLGLANYLPTRFASSAVLVAAGQIVLLKSHLPLMESFPRTPWDSAVGLGLFATAHLAATWVYLRRRLPENTFDAQWTLARDALGAMWGLRILQRINAAASTYRWPFSLTWTGFYFHDAGDDWANVSPEIQQDLQQTMAGILRRFVRVP